MAEEQKTPVVNTEAEKDVQNVLAELKGESGASEQQTQDADEARIVAEAAKLGEKSEKAEEKSSENQEKRETRSFQRGGRGGRGGARYKTKFDPSTLEETDDPVEIRKQVEFYFSDSNLPMDKFLLSKVGGSANNAVSLELLHSFKRMRRFQPFTAIVEALKTAENVELTDNDTAVKRKVPLPESINDVEDKAIKVFEDASMARSIYVKGFGFGQEEPTTQLDIEAFFAPYGPTNAIRLRRTNDKTFKGSIFVEFVDEDKQKAFLALEEKPQWKGKELIYKSKKEYCDEKVEEIKAGKVYPSDGRNRGRSGGRGRGGRGGGRGRGGRGGDRRGDRNGDRDGRDWRDRRTEDQQNGFQAPKEAQKDSRGVPVVQNTKRSRDDEGTSGDHPAKKADTKE